MTIFYQAAAILADAVERFMWLALSFAALALLVKGRNALRAASDSAAETRVNLVYYLTDAVAVAPLLSILAGAAVIVIQAHGLVLLPADFWAGAPVGLVLLAAF